MGQVIKLKRGELREALIDYAMDAVDEGTIEIMSLRQAARDLGVSSGAVYRHFADKERLLIEITHSGFLDLKERFRQIRPEDDPSQSLDQVIERMRAQIGRPAKVVATGGLAILFDEHTDIFDAVDADLTLEGLAILAGRAEG